MRRTLFIRLFIVFASLAVLPVMLFTIIYIFMQERGVDPAGMKLYFMGFMLVLISCSFIISYLFALKTEKPLKELGTAAEIFSRGDFEYRVQRTEIEDFQRVNNAVNEMAMAVSLLAKELEDSKNYFKQLYDSISNYIIIISPNRSIIEVNEKFLCDTGLEYDDVVGKKCWEVIHAYTGPCEEQGLECHLDEVYRDGVQRSTTHINVVEGKKHIHNVIYTPIRDKKGVINFVIEDIRDISSIAEMQERIKESEKMAALGRLISGLSHEINNPLAIISGYVQFASEACLFRDEKADDILDKIKDATDRIGKLMRVLMGFAGIESVPPHPIPINDAVRSALSLLQNEAHAGSVNVAVELDESAPSVMAREDIIRAFYNIAANAIDAMSAAGERTLTIKSEAIGDIVRVAFSDTGTGVPEENLSRLIEPFFTTKEFGRLGMGLTASYSIVTNYGGDIRFVNKDGLSVIITLKKVTGQNEENTRSR